RLSGPGSLFTHYGLPARDVTVARNRTEGSSDTLVSLFSVEDAVIEDNVSGGRGSLAFLDDTRDAAVYGNEAVPGASPAAVGLQGGPAPNRGTVIEGNDFNGADGAFGVAVIPGGVAGTLTVRDNRFRPGTRGLSVGSESSVDARYNWWGCNAGPGAAAC